MCVLTIMILFIYLHSIIINTGIIIGSRPQIFFLPDCYLATLKIVLEIF